jgi:hypothetical protein
MRKVFVVSAFFLTTPLLFLFSLVFFLYVSHIQGPKVGSIFGQQNTGSFAALPTAQNVFIDEVTAEDARTEKIRQFLDKYDSPLEPHAKYIVEVADTYGLDYRLIPAIAMQESNLCKKSPEDSNNCWGFGIYGGKITRFDSLKQAIEKVTHTLATKYKDRGLITPDEIQGMYTPSSNGSWAFSVNHFMEQL